MMGRILRMGTALSLTLATCASWSIPAGAATDWRGEGPRVLVMTYRVSPEARPNLRTALKTSLLPRLEGLRARKDLASYRVLANRFVDSASWDALVELEFTTPDALAKWRKVEETHPAGLTPAELKLVSSIETAPGTTMRAHPALRKPGEAPPVYLVVPYDYLVSIDDYLRYVDGYLLPQVDGWIGEGALSGYDLFLPRYPAGRAWSALLTLEYRGDDGLARRDAVVQRVRARLAASSPAWKAYADNKQTIRTERQPVVADEILP